MTCSRIFVVGVAGAVATLSALAPMVHAEEDASEASQAAPAKSPAAGAQGSAAAVAAPAAGPAAKPAAPYPFGLPEARLRIVRKQVQILGGGEPRVARRDDVVLPGQRLSTPAQSNVEVAFADGNRLWASENTEVSIYGVAPAVAPGKKPPPFRPGTTTLTRGEVVLTVAAPPAPPPAAPPVAGKPVKKPPVKKPVAKISPAASVATPVGRVTGSPGSQVRITVDATGVTRVAVYRGQAQLQGPGKTKPILLAAGSGSNIKSAKTPAAPAQPLPVAPTLSLRQQLFFSTGNAVDIPGTFAPAPGAPPPAQWRVQIGRDPAFDEVQFDNRYPATETRLFAQPLPNNQYFVRVSAINEAGAEGPSASAGPVRVSRLTLTPGSPGKPATVTVSKFVYCGLDGAPLAPSGQPMPLSPAQDHLLRCSLGQAGGKPEESAEYKITAAQSGPLVAEQVAGAAQFNSNPTTKAIEGEREVILKLSDAAGNPLAGAALTVEGQGGAQAQPVKESATAGTYLTTVRWPAGKTGLALRYRINDVESYEAALPDALPPAPSTPAEKPADEKPAVKRVAFELGVNPLAHIDTVRQVFGIGAGLELGARIRLPYGGLGIAVRPQYEYFSAAPATSHVIAVGVPITYRIRKDLEADVVPYLGVLPQVLYDFSYLSRDGIRITDGEWRLGFGIGGLVGTEFHLKRGAVFAEGGYRHVLIRTAPDDHPSLNGVFVNIGYRVAF